MVEEHGDCEEEFLKIRQQDGCGETMHVRPMRVGPLGNVFVTPAGTTETVELIVLLSWVQCGRHPTSPRRQAHNVILRT